MSCVLFVSFHLASLYFTQSSSSGNAPTLAQCLGLCLIHFNDGEKQLPSLVLFAAFLPSS